MRVLSSAFFLAAFTIARGMLPTSIITGYYFVPDLGLTRRTDHYVIASTISALSCDDYNPIVRNEVDLEALSSCGKLVGNIAIEGDFSGSFHLPGIWLIGNTLYEEAGFNSIEEITEISMPDLSFVVEGINLEGLSKLHTFSMPKLRSIGEGRQLHNPSPELTRITNFGGPLLNLSFPELESVSMTWFGGNIGR